MGYAFLFRNYRGDLGKWQTTDPLGYPDGWNNLAYCKNLVTSCIDGLGTWTLNVLGDSSGTSKTTLGYRIYDASVGTHLEGCLSVAYSISGSGSSTISISISATLYIRKTNAAGTADYGIYLSTTGSFSFSVSIDVNGNLSNTPMTNVNLGNGTTNNKITSLGRSLTSNGQDTYSIYAIVGYIQNYGGISGSGSASLFAGRFEKQE